MKVAVTSTGPTLDDQVEARFGRCPYFNIIDTDSMECQAVENPNCASAGGAGIQSAQMMAEKDVSHVLTGNCGPNALDVFGQAGVNVVVGVSGSVREAVKRFKNGEFSSAGDTSVTSRFGRTAGDPQRHTNLDESAGTGIRRRGGRGMGRGRNRGRGRGRGSGMSRAMPAAGGSAPHLGRRMNCRS